MRIIIPISILTLLLVNSCDKPSVTKRTFKYVGYIYNIEDSLPFINTKFKVYNKGVVYRSDDDSTFIFYTDSNGYFDVTINFLGSVYWPSYFHGAGYGGPGSINSNGDSFNVKKNEWATMYKGYTKPYF
jgi:hypothetical protein